MKATFYFTNYNMYVYAYCCIIDAQMSVYSSCKLGYISHGGICSKQMEEVFQDNIF